MPDLKQILTEEIRRLARKEIKLAVEPLHHLISTQRKTLAEQSRKIAQLEKQLGVTAPVAEKAPETLVCVEKKLRLTPERISSLRKKLGVSQKEFAVLLGASTFSVCHWESGKTTPRAAQKQKIAAIRGLGKRELAKLIAEKLPEHKAAKKA